MTTVIRSLSSRAWRHRAVGVSESVARSFSFRIDNLRRLNLLKHLVIGMIAVSSLALSATATAVSTEVAALPGSMNEFVNWNLDRGVCGTWSDTGVTEAM